jgi:hypothetical protein
MSKLIISFLAAIVFLIGCTNSTNSSDKASISKNEEIEDSKFEEDGPPFKIKCNSQVREFGRLKLNDSILNVYFSGKNWNPNNDECTYIWGEIINNIVPEEDVKLLKIHLLDLDSFLIPDNQTDYGIDSIYRYVVCVYYYKPDSGSYEIFDPFKTGKYPKPKGWQ